MFFGKRCGENRERLRERVSIDVGRVDSDIPLFQRSNEPEVERCAGCLEEGFRIVCVVRGYAITVAVVRRIEVEIEWVEVILQRSEEESVLVFCQDDGAAMLLCGERADERLCNDTINGAVLRSTRGRRRVWLHIDREDAPEGLSRREAHVGVHGEAPGVNEARVVGSIASCFDEGAVLREHPTVGCIVRRRDGEDFEDVSRADLERFRRRRAPSSTEELCEGDRGAEAGDGECKCNGPTAIWIVEHR